MSWSASKAHIWSRCSAYPHLPRPEFTRDSEDARRGTAAHWVLQGAYEGGVPAARFTGCEHAGVLVDEDMAETVQFALDYLGGGWRLEQTFTLPDIRPDAVARLDLLRIEDDGATAHIADFKTGHREVEPLCEQLVMSAAGFLHVQTIKLTVIAPNQYPPIKTWEGSPAELQARLDFLRSRANEQPPVMRTGNHCRDCEHINNCSAARIETYRWTERQPELDGMSPANLGAEYDIVQDAARLIKERKEAIEDQIKHLIATDGGVQTGYTVQQTNGRQVWSCDVEKAVSFASLFGVDAAKAGVMTPKQTMQKVPAAQRDAYKKALDAVTERTAGSTQLTKISKTRAFRAFTQPEK